MCRPCSSPSTKFQALVPSRGTGSKPAAASRYTNVGECRRFDDDVEIAVPDATARQWLASTAHPPSSHDLRSASTVDELEKGEDVGRATSPGITTGSPCRRARRSVLAGTVRTSGGGLQLEPGAQRGDVVPVSSCDVVTGVEVHLPLRRQQPHRRAATGCRCAGATSSALLRYTRSGPQCALPCSSSLDDVDVDDLAGLVAVGQPPRLRVVVAQQLEAAIGQVAGRRTWRRRSSMMMSRSAVPPRLLAEQGVDAPPAREPRHDAELVGQVEERGTSGCVISRNVIRRWCPIPAACRAPSRRSPVRPAAPRCRRRSR